MKIFETFTRGPPGPYYDADLKKKKNSVTQPNLTRVARWKSRGAPIFPETVKKWYFQGLESWKIIYVVGS